MTKSKIVIIVGACALAAAPPAQAQEQVAAEGTAPEAAGSGTLGGVELGAELFSYSYRERIEGEVIASDDGVFGGITAGYVQRLGSGWFLRARLASSWGSVDYSSSQGRIENVSQDVGQLEIHAGHDFRLPKGATLTAFAGVGGRVLNDYLGGEQTEDGSLGYDREIGYAYVPIGLAAGMSVGGNKSLVVSGQFNWVFGGTARSEFSEIDPETPDLELDLDGGFGLEASAMLRMPVGGSTLSVGPFVRYWNIEESESRTFREDDLEFIFVEPPSRTTELGLRLAFTF